MRWWCGKGECWGDGGVGREWAGTSSRERETRAVGNVGLDERKQGGLDCFRSRMMVRTRQTVLGPKWTHRCVSEALRHGQCTALTTRAEADAPWRTRSNCQ